MASAPNKAPRKRLAVPANDADEEGPNPLPPAIEPGSRASVSRVPDDDAELLRYLGELGIVPGSDLELVAQAPFGGPVTVRTERGEHAISRELADRIAAA